MVGTIFLWMFWPSFNGALVVGEDLYNSVSNTVLSLAACCIVAFAMSSLMRPKYKFNMVDIQNATLAGGVAVGSSCNLNIQPASAAAIGGLAALVSVLGYNKVTPFLERRGLLDTCGVNNLHGLPGILGGLVSSVAVAAGSMNCVNPGKMAGIQIAFVGISVGIALASGLFTGMVLSHVRAWVPRSLFDDSEWWDEEEDGEFET